MSVINEGRHSSSFILSEAAGLRSRDNVTLASGQKVVAGQVLGIVTSGGKYAQYDNQGSNGTQTAAAIALDNYDATSADLPIVVICRDAEVIGAELTYDTVGGSPAIDTPAAIADLKAVGIIVR